MTRCWLNGRILDVSAARIDPSDRGFTLGDGLFETLKVHDGRPAHLARHLARLRQGAALLGIEVPADDATIGAALLDLAARIEAQAARITLTRGPAARGVLPHPAGTPTLLIRLAPIDPTPDRVEAILCRGTRRNQLSPLARVKSLNYLDSVLAGQEASRAGAQDAILLNTNGNVAEATASNVFVAQAAALFTPPIYDGALPGIARALLIERAGAVERTLTPHDLSTADAVILSSSLGLRTLSRLDRQTYPAAPGLLQRLRACL